MKKWLMYRECIEKQLEEIGENLEGLEEIEEENEEYCYNITLGINYIYSLLEDIDDEVYFFNKGLGEE